eukprot:jgi/Mesen1/4143/ME000218S03262
MSNQLVELDPALYGFSEGDLDREFFLGVWNMSGFLHENRPVQTLRAILQRLEQTYCGSIGYEYMHISDREQCNWLRGKIETLNMGSVYLEELQRTWERDPKSVDASWDLFFRNFTGQAGSGAAGAGISGQTIQESMRLLLLVRAYQVNGHMKAKLDPLGLDERPPPGGPALPPSPPPALFLPLAPPLLALLSPGPDGRALSQSVSFGPPLSSGSDFPSLWGSTRAPPSGGYSKERREVILDRLMWSSNFETFLAQKWGAAKRFGLEGCETLVPGMKELIDRAADAGVESVVLGMPHRGRLNVLGNVVRKPLRQIFSEFSGGIKPVDAEKAAYTGVYTGIKPVDAEEIAYTGTGDVKYHLGTSYDRPTRTGKRVHLSLVANPSHLEAVNPVVIGKTRAKQYYTGDADRTRALAVLLHGDGSFSGQGVVYETLHLQDLPNYTSGGTIHIVVNNQVAFTTDPKSSRSSPYCTDVAKALHCPILHVNGDDAEAVVRCCELACDWRQRFHTDIVIDIVVKPEILKEVGKKLAELPEGFTPHRGIKRVYEARRQAIESEKGVDWATAEALAFATLLVEGNHVRLSGQDVERGTFSHRHSVIHDQETGAKHTPLCHILEKQPKDMFTVSNSSLSEFGVLGFELGYSMENPNSLVLWEAQFGDFANGAQVVFDQFISSGESKWLRQSGLVCLLPHGYDGQGPEHSSARLERFLQIQNTNWQIVNVTTPANYFHVLRRQIHRDFRKPLIVMSPKNLLRHPLCKSDLSEFDDVAGHPGFDRQGTKFKRLMKDKQNHSAREEGVRRLLLCSGKIYYELDEERERTKSHDVAICRVEQLCPFPYDLFDRELKRYPNAEVVWVQEEPMNMGAYTYVFPRMATGLRDLGRGTFEDVKYVGRAPSAATATGYNEQHKREQKEVTEKPFQMDPLPFF